MGSVFYSKRLPTRTAVRRERSRGKSFKSEEAAKTWADKEGIKDYKLVNLKSEESETKKINVVY